MNQMMYKEINVNKVLYKTLVITNFNSKNMRFFFNLIYWISKLNSLGFIFRFNDRFGSNTLKKCNFVLIDLESSLWSHSFLTISNYMCCEQIGWF